MAATSSEIDEQLMRRAIRLAMNGRGRVEPNPMVGCVIVTRDGRVIGEGFHAQFGGPHAEPNALANCTESPAGATAYVTLEPCCHTNKKTPPCTPRLIEAKIARVVYGCLDPNPPVNGKGVAMLRKAGIQVHGPILEDAAKQLIAPFLAEQWNTRTYLTLKWAQSADGKVAGRAGKRLQISGPEATMLVHRLRARSDVIVVGIGTVLADDPALTARIDEPTRSLTRVVVDSRLRIPLDSKVVSTAREHETVIMCSEKMYSAPSGKRRAQELDSRGVYVEPLSENHDGTLSLSELRRRLRSHGGGYAHLATHALVEPGPCLARSFLDAGLADRVWVFVSPRPIDEPTAPAAAPLPELYIVTGTLRVGDDTLTEYMNSRSELFFAPEPSADFVLARDALATSSRP